MDVIPDVLIPVVRMFLVNPVKKRCRAMLALGEKEGGKLVFGELQAILERDFNLVGDCYSENKLAINVKKTKVMLAGSIKKDRAFSSFDDVNLQMNGTQVELDSNVNILERGRPPKKFFRPLSGLIWSKNKGWPGPPGPSPGSATDYYY